METFSLTDIKKKNLSDVYHYIYSNPGCSKQAIASALSISLPTVSQHLSTLLKEALIEKCGQLSSSVGRRAMAYRTVPTARIAIGVEILPRNIYIVALNLYGKKEAKEKFNLSFRPSQDYFTELKELINNFLKKYNYKEEQLLGIGLGMQGLTSPDGSKMTYGKILDCTGLSIRTDDPSQLGSELVCSAIAVLADYPPPCVIISMDTAVSITALDNRGALRGGAILPGVKIGVEALCARTAQLPQIDLSAPACGVLGTNSSASMQAGAIFGTASMLDGMIDRFAQALGGTPTCVASGELAPVILPHCLHKIYYRENLVLDGLYRLYQKNTK